SRIGRCGWITSFLRKNGIRSIHRLLMILLFSFEGAIPQNIRVVSSEQIKETTDRAPQRTTVREEHREEVDAEMRS
ncbi:hypothetical protein, partial [Niallia sp. MER 6]|uniref:hypothetical protein n=1 Tax=Niallia sp. MER 6 TaxID=2939567 RepID=UPI00203C05E6